MSTIREHLKAMHANRAEHHSKMSRLHKEAMESHEPDSAEHRFHEAAMTAHLDAGENCAAMAQACAKAASADDLEKSALVPTEVSGIAPPAYRAVPRAGQREIPNDVAPDLQKFVSVND